MALFFRLNLNIGGIIIEINSGNLSRFVSMTISGSTDHPRSPMSLQSRLGSIRFCGLSTAMRKIILGINSLVVIPLAPASLRLVAITCGEGDALQGTSMLPRKPSRHVLAPGLGEGLGNPKAISFRLPAGRQGVGTPKEMREMVGTRIS